MIQDVFERSIRITGVLEDLRSTDCSIQDDFEATNPIMGYSKRKPANGATLIKRIGMLHQLMYMKHDVCAISCRRTSEINIYSHNKEEDIKGEEENQESCRRIIPNTIGENTKV